MLVLDFIIDHAAVLLNIVLEVFLHEVKFSGPILYAQTLFGDLICELLVVTVHFVINAV